MNNRPKLFRRLRGLAVVASLLFPLLAPPTRAQQISADDLFEASSGITVTASSELDTIPGLPALYDIRNIFGTRGGDYVEGRLGTAVFQDLKPAGFVHFVEWRTRAPVTLRSIRLFASGDGDRQGQREFASFRLLARSEGSSAFDIVVCEFTPVHPYAFLDRTTGLVLDRNVATVVARDFRAEFVNRPGLLPISNGPRIYEIDGLGTRSFVPMRSGARAVNVCVDSQPGVAYQMQSRPDAEGAGWASVGAPMTGTGGPLCFAQRIDDAPGSTLFRVESTVPSAMSIEVSETELCWESVLGVNYLVEARDFPKGSSWHAEGPAVAGTGTTLCVSRAGTGVVYRVRALE